MIIIRMRYGHLLIVCLLLLPTPSVALLIDPFSPVWCGESQTTLLTLEGVSGYYAPNQPQFSFVGSSNNLDPQPLHSRFGAAS